MSGERPGASFVEERPKYTLWYNLVTCAGDEAFSVETSGFSRWQMFVVDIQAHVAAAALINTHNQTYHTGAGSNKRCNPAFECTSTR